jgi:CD109 antigen
LANGALTSLIQQKDSFGTWHNTQATILALKALIETVRSGADDVDATVTVTLNGGETRTVEVGPENFDVVQMIHFEDVKLSDNQVAIEVTGKGNLMYQVTSSYYLPWDKLALYPEAVPAEDMVSIDVEYDRTELTVDDMVTVNVTVSLNVPGSRAEWALIDLGVPPGFSVQAEDLATLVAVSKDRLPDSEQATIERYELTGRQILVYIGKLSEGDPLNFSYRLKAKFPMVAQTPASNAYDYYNPAVSGEAEPQLLVVSE